MLQDVQIEAESLIGCTFVELKEFGLCRGAGEVVGWLHDACEEIVEEGGIHVARLLHGIRQMISSQYRKVAYNNILPGMDRFITQ